MKCSNELSLCKVAFVKLHFYFLSYSEGHFYTFLFSLFFISLHYETELHYKVEALPSSSRKRRKRIVTLALKASPKLIT